MAAVPLACGSVTKDVEFNVCSDKFVVAMVVSVELLVCSKTLSELLLGGSAVKFAGSKIVPFDIDVVLSVASAEGRFIG